MLKQTIKYTDFNDTEREEVFYFNLTKAEILEMEASHNNGLLKTVERLQLEKDNFKIIEVFKSIILKAYGEKSEDGKRFIKSKELSDSFAATEAYSELFISMLNAEKAVEFISGIIPKEK
jgi:hypothetical protein